MGDWNVNHRVHLLDRRQSGMIILALLILLAIVCGYSWVTYRIKTTRPEIVVTVPKARG